ncbi:MAG TPA: hypothetical protein V6C71_10115 [Coleofasciculaceae cyanobacterium]|jgi:hypothetical protein
MSITYPDSMPSFNIPRTQRGKPYLKPFDGQVFTLDEIAEVVQTYGLPEDRGKVEWFSFYFGVYFIQHL